MAKVFRQGNVSVTRALKPKGDRQWSVVDDTFKVVLVERTTRENAEAIASYFGRGGEGGFRMMDIASYDPWVAKRMQAAIRHITGDGPPPVEPGEGSEWIYAKFSHGKGGVPVPMLARDGLLAVNYELAASASAHSGPPVEGEYAKATYNVTYIPTGQKAEGPYKSRQHAEKVMHALASGKLGKLFTQWLAGDDSVGTEIRNELLRKYAEPKPKKGGRVGESQLPLF